MDRSSLIVNRTRLERSSTLDYPFDAILSAAVCAPSGDNTQPWRFVVDQNAGMINLELDESRDRSPMNAGQRMARIAVGAALENILRTTRYLGWTASLEEGTPPSLARVRLSRNVDGESRIEPVIKDRVTNRRLYDGRSLSPDIVSPLIRETTMVEGVSTHWIADPERLPAWADLIGRADAMMFGHPSMRRAFLEKVRFDATDQQTVDEGLSLASLELSAIDRIALRLMRRCPDWVFQLGGARTFDAKARQLVLSSSGLCLIVAPDETSETDIRVGQAMQRAWLALTARGLAAQPMMSLLVLDNVLKNGDDALVMPLERTRVLALLDELRELAPEIGDQRPAFLLRFGYALPPGGRTGRLPVIAHEASNNVSNCTNMMVVDRH